MLDGFHFKDGRDGESTKMIDYFMPLPDRYGYIHSIDNLVTFYLTDISVSELLEVIRAKSKTFAYLDYWERLDLPVRRNFANFIHEIHFGDLFIKIGKRKEEKTSYGSKTIKTIDCIRFEINPNKHHTTKEWDFMLELIDAHCFAGVIDKFDYAIDIPVPPDKVVVVKSRKTYGFFNGTRYYGKRNKHGYVKIYDKFKERFDEAQAMAKKLDIRFTAEDYYPCTRIETTLKNGQPFSGVDFGVAGAMPGAEDGPALSPQGKMYLEMLQHILLLGGDIDGHLRHMNPRSRVAVEPYIYGSLTNYEYDFDILIRLLKDLAELLHLKPYSFNTPGVFVADDGDGDAYFALTDDDFPLLPLPGEK